MKRTSAVKRTRIAPTPSGFLHVGNIFSFAMTVAMARREGASVLLRIDDLDRERASRVYVEDIFDTLRFMGIPWDEGPKDVDEFESTWSQAHRMGVYAAMLERLKGLGAVFACTCSRSQLAGEGVHPGTCRDRGLSLEASGVNWRLRTDGSTLPSEMTDFVVRKKDGWPAYQLASVADDVHFGVDLVVRGNDLWASTQAQLYLADVLGLEAFGKVNFFHHPLLTDADGEKLSKSAGDTSIQQLRKHGLKPDAIYSRIARLLGREAPARNWEELAVLADLF